MDFVVTENTFLNLSSEIEGTNYENIIPILNETLKLDPVDMKTSYDTLKVEKPGVNITLVNVLRNLTDGTEKLKKTDFAETRNHNPENGYPLSSPSCTIADPEPSNEMYNSLQANEATTNSFQMPVTSNDTGILHNYSDYHMLKM